MKTALYVDTSAILRAILESGVSPEIESRVASASILVSSRLSQVEAARALARVRHEGRVPETRLADAARALDDLWARCHIWELTPAVCDLAGMIAPSTALRTLDALHVATFLLARRQLGDIEMLTADTRLRDAVERV